jgi:hypothetical protein
MGLTIHYSLRAKASTKPVAAKALLEELRKAALDLPVAEVSEVREFTPKDFENDTRDYPDKEWAWALCQAGTYVDIGGGRSVDVNPESGFMLRVWPGEGCEEANFGLFRYPKSVVSNGTGYAVKQPGWSWASFCKTQYANEKGNENFLRCHLSVIRLLDVCKKIGILKSANDEGLYWDKRDVPALVKEIGEWDSMIATFGGALKDATGGNIVAPIFSYTNFENLEAKGTLTKSMQKVVGLIKDTMKKKADQKPS